MCQPLFFISAIIKAQRGTENKKKTKPLKTKNKMKKEITTMKKNAIIYIDDTHAQVTKAFEKQARIFGTPEYSLLQGRLEALGIELFDACGR